MTWELATNAVDIEEKQSHIPRPGTIYENMMSSLEGKSTFAITQRARCGLPKLLNRENQLKIFVNLFFSFTFTALVDGFIFKMRNKNNFGTAHF